MEGGKSLCVERGLGTQREHTRCAGRRANDSSSILRIVNT